MNEHPSHPDLLMSRMLGVCWHSPTSDRWPCQERQAEVANGYISEICKWWETLPDAIKAILTAEATVDETARCRARSLMELADRLHGPRSGDAS